MKLIEFPEQTTVFAKNQPQYVPLPAHVVAGDPEGRIICCWRLTWRERLALLFRGVVWHHVLTFGQALQPQLLQIEKPEMIQRQRGWRCWWFGCVPGKWRPDTNTTPCTRCGAHDVVYTDFVGDTRHRRFTDAIRYRVIQPVKYWLFSRWYTSKCKTCGKRQKACDECDIPW